MHTYMYIMTKVISLSDEAYNDLKSLKAQDESFSDIVKALASTAKKEKILELAGAWSSTSEMNGIFKNIMNERHKIKGRNLRL